MPVKGAVLMNTDHPRMYLRQLFIVFPFLVFSLSRVPTAVVQLVLIIPCDRRSLKCVFHTLNEQYQIFSRLKTTTTQYERDVEKTGNFHLFFK